MNTQGTTWGIRECAYADQGRYMQSPPPHAPHRGKAAPVQGPYSCTAMALY